LSRSSNLFRKAKNQNPKRVKKKEKSQEDQNIKHRINLRKRKECQTERGTKKPKKRSRDFWKRASFKKTKDLALVSNLKKLKKRKTKRIKSAENQL
jgi:hypothetical protein